MNTELKSLQLWLTRHGPPMTDKQIVERLNRIRKTNQRTYGSFAVEMALEAAYQLGLQASVEKAE